MGSGRPALGTRDIDVARGVARFGRLSAGQIRDLYFHDVTRGPYDRSIQRLISTDYLVPIERFRLTGGRIGGSGQHVYGLGRRGHDVFREGDYRRPGALAMKDHHTLDVAGLYVDLMKLDRAGDLTLLSASVEAECYMKLGKIELRPDLYITAQPLRHVGLPDVRLAGGQEREVYVEVDRGTEHEKRIHQKLAGYVNAGTSELWPRETFPSVVFVADEIDLRALRRYLASFRMPYPDGLFRLMTRDDFLRELSTGK